MWPLLFLSPLFFGTIQAFDVEMEMKAAFQQERFKCVYFIIHFSPEKWLCRQIIAHMTVAVLLLLWHLSPMYQSVATAIFLNMDQETAERLQTLQRCHKIGMVSLPFFT